MQPEKFAGCQPIFLAGLENLAGLADDLKLVVAKKLLQRSLDSSQFRRNRLRLRDIFGDNEPAPNRLRSMYLRRHAYDQRDKSGKEREPASHEESFRCVIRWQRL